VGEFVLLWEGATDQYETNFTAWLPGWRTGQPPPAWWSQNSARVVHTIKDYLPNSRKPPGAP
jgi:hypothetical protein